MGGGDFPTGVWSPAGGWYADPKHWKRNTAFAFAVMFAVAVPVFYKSAQLEQRHVYPTRPIPSQRWCKNFPPPPEADSADTANIALGLESLG